MKCNWRASADNVVSSLSPDEREGSIAYIEQRIIPAGEEIALAGITGRYDEAVIMAFVDLQPGLNWTHRGRYIILGLDGVIQQICPADRPPFLTRISPGLRLIHCGDRAPEWAAATSSRLEE